MLVTSGGSAPDEKCLAHPRPGAGPNPTLEDDTWEGYFALVTSALKDAAARAPAVNRALPSPSTPSPSSTAAASCLPDLNETTDAASGEGGDDAGGVGRWSVYAVSDLHTDMKANMAWVRGLPRYPPRTALIVAGSTAPQVDRPMLLSTAHRPKSIQK